jgi:hypothetical protein
MLLVLAWKTPRRMNNTERTALPLFTEIAARTNGVIEQEREMMRTQLESSLRVEDYAAIEHEYTHQWNKRVRTMRQNARFALEALDEAGASPDADTLAALRQRLEKIVQAGTEGLERMGVAEYLRGSQRIALKSWLKAYVERWNLLDAGDGHVACTLESNLGNDQSLTTRPVILTWILNELLLNAREAERTLPAADRALVIAAGFNPARREFEISVMNNKLLPREELEAIRNRSPLQRDNKSGRGVWIVGGQVRNLLGGVLQLPDPEDKLTRFTIALPESIDGIARP